MLLEIGLITGGVPVGFFLRRSQRIKNIVGKALTWAVWLLLFLLGINLGSDRNLLNQIQILGAQAVIISVFSVLGSVCAAWLLGRFLFPDAFDSPRKNQAGTSNHAALRGSLLVLTFFFCGILTGFFGIAPQSLIESNASLWVLYCLLFCAGMGVGFDLKALGIIRELKAKILLVPLGIVAGTMLGSLCAWLVVPDMLLPEALSVGGGFGYYSLATVIMTQMGSPALGSVALLSNMIREIITLTLSPLLVRFFGRLAPVMSGGAAAMDTCLPVVAQNSGERYAVIAVFSGMCLTLLVPLFVPMLMALR